LISDKVTNKTKLAPFYGPRCRIWLNKDTKGLPVSLQSTGITLETNGRTGLRVRYSKGSRATECYSPVLCQNGWIVYFSSRDSSIIL